jgi:uncharacterized protein YegP (UPF0339 family)
MFGTAITMRNLRSATMKFQIVKGKSATQPFFWRIVASNGQTLAVSENYAAKASAKSAVESVIKNAGGAKVEDLT